MLYISVVWWLKRGLTCASNKEIRIRSDRVRRGWLELGKNIGCIMRRCSTKNAWGVESLSMYRDDQFINTILTPIGSTTKCGGRLFVPKSIWRHIFIRFDRKLKVDSHNSTFEVHDLWEWSWKIEMATFQCKLSQICDVYNKRSAYERMRQRGGGINQGSRWLRNNF